jgi:hypothetical protein
MQMLQQNNSQPQGSNRCGSKIIQLSALMWRCPEPALHSAFLAQQPEKVSDSR